MTWSYTIAEMIWKRMAREIECILLAGHWKHKQSEVVLLAGCEHGGQPTVRQQRLGLSHPKKHSQNSHPFGPRSRLTAEISEADMTVRIAPDFSIRSILSLTQSIAVIQSQFPEIGRLIVSINSLLILCMQGLEIIARHVGRRHLMDRRLSRCAS